MSLQGLGIAGATVRETPTTDNNDEKRPQTASTIPGESSVQSSPQLSIGPDPAPDFDPSIGAKPHSPFYRHATPSLSLEQLTWKSRHGNRSPTRMADVEAQESQTPSVKTEKSKLSKLWRKKKQPWELLDGLSKKQRIAAKALITIVTVGAMVGIALGITSAVGGGVWKYDGQQGAVRG